MKLDQADDLIDEVRQRLRRQLDGHWPEPSYAAGAAGQLLCLSVLEARAQSRGESRGLQRDWVEAQVARLLSQTWRMPHGLFQGMQGVLYAAQELDQAFDLDFCDDDLNDADALLLDALRSQEGEPEHFDLISGISGLLAYAVYRESRGGHVPLVEACLQQLELKSSGTGGRRHWFTPPAWIRGFPMGDANPLGCTDLGLAHGQAGVLAALALTVAASEAGQARAEPLLRGLLSSLAVHEQQGCDWHFSSAIELPGGTRCAWCYGDLGMAAALRLAAAALGQDELDDWADRLIVSLQRRSAAQLGFVDAWLCHGSLGSAWMLEQITPGLRGPVVEHCLSFQGVDQLLAELRTDEAPPLGLLEGHAGLAVVLAEAQGFEPALDWCMPFLAGRRALRPLRIAA